MKRKLLNNLLPVPLPGQFGSPSYRLVPHHREVGTAGKVLRDGNSCVEIENYMPPATYKYNTDDHFWLHSRKQVQEQPCTLFSHSTAGNWTLSLKSRQICHHVIFPQSYFSTCSCALQILGTEGCSMLSPNYQAHEQDQRFDLTAPHWLLTVYLTARTMVTQTTQ